jgi:protein phosphatase 2C family protein 2/3
MLLPAEFRGPGVHHNYEDSDSGYDVDAESGGKFNLAGSRGRIIFLGDGTEVLTGSDDTEMFDNADEDKDLASQVSKGSAKPDAKEEPEAKPESDSKPAVEAEKKQDEKAPEESKKD